MERKLGKLGGRAKEEFLLFLLDPTSNAKEKRKL